MRFYQLFIFGLILLLSSCKCEGTFSTLENVKNLSSIAVSIKAYRDGLVTDIVFLNSGAMKQVGSTSGRSKGTGFPGSYSTSDSVIVEFGGKKKSVHYGRRSGNNPNAILLSSGRSLYVEANYTRKTLIDEECYLETEFVYTFTEEDYVNAK
jgi:hypothetical protein